MFEVEQCKEPTLRLRAVQLSIPVLLHLLARALLSATTTLYKRQ